MIGCSAERIRFIRHRLIPANRDSEKLIEGVRNLGFGLRLAMVVALCGCARLPPTSAVTIPPIPAGMARVWLYRADLPYVAQERPYVRMNGAVVGISEDGGAFYRDVAPGEYYVIADSYGTDVNQFPHIALVPGQTAYLQVFGWDYWASGGGGTEQGGGGDWRRPTFYVRLMPNNIGAQAVAGLPFDGGS
jgi:hypothetical protein